MKRKKQLVFFDGNLKQGGAERVISLLANRFVQDGKDVCVLLYQDQELFYKLDSRVRVVSVQRETKSKNVIKNIIWMHSFFYDNAKVVISFLAIMNILAIIAHVGIKCPLIVADRNDPRFVPGNFFIRKCRDVLYNFVDGIVLQTTKNKMYFSKRIQSKSIIIPNPVNIGNRIRVKRKSEKEIISVGRLMPQKNQMMLIDAWRMIADDYPDYHLIIYGEGPERTLLEARIKELKIEDKVRLPGEIKNIYEEMSKAQLFVLTSNYEGMPNALIEAMCIGLPCIATDVSGVRDLIADGENGIIVECNNKNELAKKISFLIEDENIRLSIGRKAVLLNKRLNVDNIIECWEKFIKRLEIEVK